MTEPNLAPFKVDDRVQIYRPATEEGCAEEPGWTDEMDDYIGEVGVVIGVDSSRHRQTWYTVEFDDGVDFYFLRSWIGPASWNHNPDGDALTRLNK